MEILIPILCVVAGLVVGALAMSAWLSKKTAAAESKADHLATDLEASRLECSGVRARNEELTGKLATAEAASQGLRERLDEEGRRLAELQAHFRTEFENLANRILEEKSAKFLSQNQEHMGQLLDPLRVRIGEFKERIEAIHTEETKTAASLREQLHHLKELNQQITAEAGALTRALKGEAKTRGNWGELILERILEKSGLQKGSEYETQGGFRREDGSRLIPDAVIYLPEGKHLIIDSKVSLNAYERHVNAATEAERMAALREHTASMRRHIDELSRKDYPGLPELQSPDFVLMFVPVEPALHAALQFDQELHGFSFDRNVILVSSSTLLVTLRAIESVWRRHKQTLNALEIARRAGNLHDQFVLFAESLQDIGQRLDQARGAYDQAMARLSTGRGNLVRRVTELQKLGARAEKQISDSLLQQSTEGEDEQP